MKRIISVAALTLVFTLFLSTSAFALTWYPYGSQKIPIGVNEERKTSERKKEDNSTALCVHNFHSIPGNKVGLELYNSANVRIADPYVTVTHKGVQVDIWYKAGKGVKGKMYRLGMKNHKDNTKPIFIEGEWAP